jgi:hypothetical protein
MSHSTYIQQYYQSTQNQSSIYTKTTLWHVTIALGQTLILRLMRGSIFSNFVCFIPKIP